MDNQEFAKVKAASLAALSAEIKNVEFRYASDDAKLSAYEYTKREVMADGDIPEFAGEVAGRVAEIMMEAHAKLVTYRAEVEAMEQA